MELTALALEYFSVHLSMSSFETLLLDRSMYPLSLSTLMTTTGSVLPTRINLLIDLKRIVNTNTTERSYSTNLIRLLESSDKRIIPSMLLYSKRWT